MSFQVAISIYCQSIYPQSPWQRRKTTTEFFWPCLVKNYISRSLSQTKHTRSHAIFTFWHAHLHGRSERVKVQHWLSLKYSSDHQCSCWLPLMISSTDLSRLQTSDKIQPLVKMPSTESARMNLTGRDSSTFSLNNLTLKPSNLHIHLLPTCVACFRWGVISSHVLMPNQAQIKTFSS